MNKILLRLLTSLVIISILIPTTAARADNNSLIPQLHSISSQPQAKIPHTGQSLDDGLIEDPISLYDPSADPRHFSHQKREITQEHEYISPSPEIIAKTEAQVASFTCTDTMDIPRSECEALVALYKSTNGAGWVRSDNWLVGTRMQNWFGVSVIDSHVSVLWLEYNQLSGSIPPELVNLSNLLELRLGSNHLSGSIPTEIGNLPNLTILYLHSNQLTGPIPNALANLSSLYSLELNNNQLTGSIPRELGSLTNLIILELLSNQLSGSIPPELGNLANLSYLDLSSNQLDSSIPPELGNLANLSHLDLSSNQLTGSVPNALANLSNLRNLDLSSNQLSGSIPTELGNLSVLWDLNLSSNQLSGSIPPELGNLSHLFYLTLGSNQLSGSIPLELGSLSNLGQLNLSSNQLSGIIPPELGSLSNLTSLNLNSNQLSGSIPSELGNLSSLVYLLLYSNQLTGNIPSEVGSLSNLWDLYLYGNQLSGSVPPELGKLNTLYELKLGGNQLTGSIPISFVNLISLRNLNFYDTYLCEPNTEEFLTWKATVGDWFGTDLICEVPVSAPWTFMVFTAADNTVESPEETENLLRHWQNMYGELSLASRNNNVNLVGFWDDNSSAPRYDTFIGGETHSFPQSVELDTGDPLTLRNFITWAIERYPAEHYALIIASHGDGVLGTALDYQNNPKPEPEIIRTLTLTPVEMSQALTGLPFIDVVYLDACKVASLEIANDLVDHAGYLVASEAEIKIGKPNLAESAYTHIDRIINGYDLTDSAPINSVTTPLDLASSIARIHEDTYKVPHFLWNTAGGTVSVIDLSKIRAVVNNLDQLANLLIPRIGPDKQIFDSIYQDVQRYDTNRMADLYHFAFLIKQRFADTEIQASAKKLMDSLSDSVDPELNFYWGGWYTPIGNRSYADSHGLSIYYPSPNATHSDYTGIRISLSEGTNWSQNPILSEGFQINGIEHAWGPFLVAYTYATNPSPPDEPFPPASVPVFVPYYMINLPIIFR